MSSSSQVASPWFRPALFREKIAVVTGGGTGIGLAIAAELRQLDANVVICSRKIDHLQKGQEELEKITSKGRVEHVVCNIREEESIAAAVQYIMDRFGRIDYLVNNAGGQFVAPALALSRRGFTAVIETNLIGTFLMSKAVVEKAMQPQQSGAMVNIIAQVENGIPLMAHTGAARAGVENLTKTLAFEWSTLGIRVNAVAPGVIASSGLENYPEETRNTILKSEQKLPARRLGTPEDIAAAVVFLLSPAANFITGTTLCVDGGERLLGSIGAHLLQV